MNVTVTKYLNVRVGKPSVNAPCYQYLAPGSELVVDGEYYPGDIYEGIGTWMKDEADNYYWSGGIDDRTDLPQTPGGIPVPAYTWFRNLEIEKIWNTYNEFGDRAVVAILDTGYDINNPDLPQPVASRVFMKSNSGTITIQDNYGHGTFCASIIGSKNKSVNIGIAPSCKIMIGKISHKGELLDFNYILDGIEWAIQAGADIVSISHGEQFSNRPDIDRIQERYGNILRDRNVLVFASCGNNFTGQVISREYYPASLDPCTSVGTVDQEQIAAITVRSNKTLVHTPGIDIEGYGLKNQIEKQSGTSVSVPIVAGIMGLAVSLSKKRNDGKWNAGELLQKLIQTGKPIENFQPKIMIDPIRFFQSL
jgi:subtilisin family serine protease